MRNKKEVMTGPGNKLTIHASEDIVSGGGSTTNNFLNQHNL